MPFSELCERKLALRPSHISIMTSSLTGSLSPGEKHRSPSPRSEFLAIPEFGSPNYNTSASSPTSLSVPGSWWGFGSTGIGGAGDCRWVQVTASQVLYFHWSWIYVCILMCVCIWLCVFSLLVVWFVQYVYLCMYVCLVVCVCVCKGWI